MVEVGIVVARADEDVAVVEAQVEEDMFAVVEGMSVAEGDMSAAGERTALVREQ